MKKMATMLLIALSAGLAAAQSPVGKWKTFDEKTGKPKSIVEVYEKNGKMEAKVLQLFPKPGDSPDPVCDLCPDHRKNKKVLGMVIMSDMAKDGTEWEDGQILDPENGKIYDCKIWVDEQNKNILRVRGYIAFLFRTQAWERMP